MRRRWLTLVCKFIYSLFKTMFTISKGCSIFNKFRMITTLFQELRILANIIGKPIIYYKKRKY